MPVARPLEASPFALRPFADGDLALYVGLFTDAAVMARVGGPFDRGRAERAAASALRQQGSHEGRFRHWVIERAGETAGLLGLALRGERWAGGEAELGVLLWPAKQARGAATAAIRAVRPWAFEVASVAALTCHHAVGHPAAEALMRRTGFRPCAPTSGVALPCGWRSEAPDAPPQAREAALR